MRTGKHCLAPSRRWPKMLLLAGAVGTVCLDTVQYLRHRRRGRPPKARWPGNSRRSNRWEQAPDPGQVAKRVIEGFTQRRTPRPLGLPHQHRHALGLRIERGGYVRHPGRIAAPPARKHGLPFGAAVWISGYVILPEAGLYKPILESDAKTLAWDLTGHLAYGAGAGVTFWLFAKVLDSP